MNRFFFESLTNKKAFILYREIQMFPVIEEDSDYGNYLEPLMAAHSVSVWMRLADCLQKAGMRMISGSVWVGFKYLLGLM